MEAIRVKDNAARDTTRQQAANVPISPDSSDLVSIHRVCVLAESAPGMSRKQTEGTVYWLHPYASDRVRDELVVASDGGTGIRTQEAVRLPVFKTGAMGRSAIPPRLL